jgi:hypothetical protein
MVTHIARLGKIIGQYSPEDLANALTWGWIEGGDHWWRAGMKDWKLVSAESPLIPEHPKPIGPTRPIIVGRANISLGPRKDLPDRKFFN